MAFLLICHVKSQKPVSKFAYVRKKLYICSRFCEINSKQLYILDKHNKCLVEAEKCTFKSLNFTERHDLQEWIAKEPSSLGEDLLIIQKEYADWDKTKERLDLQTAK